MSDVRADTPGVDGTVGGARIHDRGYRGYTGERSGRFGAMRALYVFTIRRVLGFGRPFRTKALPVIVGVLAFLPAIVLIGLTVLVPTLNDEALPSYPDYYGFIISAIVVFVAFVSPEALCPDRRHKMLGTYLASPLDRFTYVVAKLAAVASIICGVTLFPPLLLAIARTLQGIGPSPGDFAILLGRILLTGTVLALFFASLALGVASLTDRKAFASAGMILLVIVSGAVASAIFQGEDSRAWATLLSVAVVPLEFVLRVYGKPSFDTVSMVAVVLALVAWIAIPLGILVWRYRTIEVTR
jgi:ABC-2 type transport system permease protein